VGDEFPSSSIVLGSLAEQGRTGLSLGFENRFTIGSDLDTDFSLDVSGARDRRVSWFGVLSHLGQNFRRVLRP